MVESVIRCYTEVDLQNIVPHSGTQVKRTSGINPEQALQRGLCPTEKHGLGAGAEAPAPTDRKAWGRSKR
ncbi:hypothetical protein BconGalA64_65200 [Burkholderia contaminans]|nr:hypothetical protein BconGalA64_65200 [Burkholderia contaminans]